MMAGWTAALMSLAAQSPLVVGQVEVLEASWAALEPSARQMERLPSTLERMDHAIWDLMEEEPAQEAGHG